MIHFFVYCKHSNAHQYKNFSQLSKITIFRPYCIYEKIPFAIPFFETVGEIFSPFFNYPEQEHNLIKMLIGYCVSHFYYELPPFNHPRYFAGYIVYLCGSCLAKAVTMMLFLLSMSSKLVNSFRYVSISFGVYFPDI